MKSARRPRKTVTKGVALTPAQKREVKKLVSHVPELKWADLGLNAITVSNAPLVNALSLIPQGQSSSQRIGDSVHIDHLSIRYRVRYGDSNQYIRVIIFQWHPSSTPTAADILANGVSGGIDNTSFYQQNTKQLYSIIHDAEYDILQAGDSFAHSYHADLRRGFQKTMVASNTAGTTSTNKIYSLLWSDSSVVPHPDIILNLRTFYRDE